MSRRINCVNCGERGHVFKRCPHPVISCGIVCLRSEGDRMTMLMVQRRDTYAYVEFIRGKYDLRNKRYIMKLLREMTREERDKIATYNFRSLWGKIWNSNKARPEYSEAEEKHAKLMSGVDFQGDVFRLRDVVAGMSDDDSYVQEWGFPKGRRSNCKETDISCAIREMKEETGIESSMYDFVNVPKMEETFKASNGVRYKHVYYVVMLKNGIVPELKLCENEVRTAEWVTLYDASKLVSDSPSRVRMLSELPVISEDLVKVVA